MKKKSRESGAQTVVLQPPQSRRKAESEDE